MIKVPGTPSPKFYKGPSRDSEESFDPTRDDWSRHDQGTKNPGYDGVGFLDEDDDDIPAWYQEDGDELDDEVDRYYRRVP